MVQEIRIQSLQESYQRPKKMILDASLLSTQHCKVRIKISRTIKGKEQHPPLHLGVVAIE